MKGGFAKIVIIKSQKQFMYGSNFCGSDVRIERNHWSLLSLHVHVSFWDLNKGQ